MMFANGQPEAWIPKRYQATPDITAWIPIAETSREREKGEGSHYWALPVCQAVGEGCQTCVLVRRAFCHGGTDLYHLTYFSHQLLGNSRSKNVK